LKENQSLAILQVDDAYATVNLSGSENFCRLMKKNSIFLVVFSERKVSSRAILDISSDFAAEGGRTSDDCLKMKLFVKQRTLKPR